MSDILVVCGEPYIHEPGANLEIIEMLKKELPEASFDLLGELYPDGQIDILKEQEKLLKADFIILQTPVYWYSMSSLTMRWIEQVFQYGWAYGKGGSKLQGKPVILGLTAGGSKESYTPGPECVLSETAMTEPMKLIFSYCGMDLKKIVFTPGMTSSAADPKEAGIREQKLHSHVDQILSGIQ